MHNEMLNTIDDKALEAVSGGAGIGATIGGVLDDALSSIGDLAGAGFGLFGDLLSGLGDFIKKIGTKF
jgi:hypothetical protein